MSSKSIGTYIILFQTIPSPAQVNNNMTLLRFSITQNNQDTYGVFAALVIREKSSGNISAQFPYKFYEFGDNDFRHSFLNATDHEVILQVRISGDPQYQANPLVANFNVPVTTIDRAAIGRLAEIIYVLAIVALPIGVIILILDFNRRTKRSSSSTSN